MTKKKERRYAIPLEPAIRQATIKIWPHWPFEELRQFLNNKKSRPKIECHLRGSQEQETHSSLTHSLTHSLATNPKDSSVVFYRIKKIHCSLLFLCAAIARSYVAFVHILSSKRKYKSISNVESFKFSSLVKYEGFFVCPLEDENMHQVLTICIPVLKQTYLLILVNSLQS